MTHKLINIALLAAAMCIPAGMRASSGVPTDAVKVINSDVAHTDDNFFVKMAIDLAGYKGLDSNRDITITPMIVSGADTVALEPLMVAGRARYYLHLRQSEDSRDVKKLYRAGKAQTIDYSFTVPYQTWMERSDLVIAAQSCGCCGEPQDIAEVPVRNIDLVPPVPPVYTPQFVFAQPTAELEKHREIRGQAYIDFPVNRTELYPDYRKNPRELAKIHATIDSVRLDKDVTFKAMTIKGYASPEGSYTNNIRLAKGRTATLKEYVLAQYDFPESIITTAYDPEDWGGLRNYVENSSIENRAGILAIIDSDLAPDPKNEEIKRRYPQQYAFLLREVYPGLRHSDYTVEYVVKNYTDVNEIIELLNTNPGKLSLNEMFAAAATMTPGTPEYNHAFEVAVLLYPDDEAANLNAANIALQAGNLEKAARYLDKAGSSPLAIYARGILAALEKNYTVAKDYFIQAARLKVADAPAAVAQIEAIEAWNAK